MLSRVADRIGRHVGRLSGEDKARLVGRLDRASRVALKLLRYCPVSMATLARISGTDKARGHDYIPTYERLLAPYRNRPITLLELGVGGHEMLAAGRSLNLWEAYFRRATIVGVDVLDQRHLSRGRVHVYQCSQTDAGALREIAERFGGFDVVIDDGSHVNEHQIESFKLLFPLMKPTGVYVVEDTQTSFWPSYGGGSPGSSAFDRSALRFFMDLVPGLNHAERLPGDGGAPTPYERAIRSIHFEHNLIAIVLGDNTAPSNADLASEAETLRMPC